MKNKIPKDRCGFSVNIGKKERDMLDVLASKHSVNLSNFVRNAIRTLYKELEGKQ